MPKGYCKDPEAEIRKREILRLASIKRWQTRRDELLERTKIVGKHSYKATAAITKPVGSTRFSNGYLLIKTSPGLWEAEHVMIVENKIGRIINKNEQVHHIDDNKLNN